MLFILPHAPLHVRALFTMVHSLLENLFPAWIPEIKLSLHAADIDQTDYTLAPQLKYI